MTNLIVLSGEAAGRAKGLARAAGAVLVDRGGVRASFMGADDERVVTIACGALVRDALREGRDVVVDGGPDVLSDLDIWGQLARDEVARLRVNPALEPA